MYRFIEFIFWKLMPEFIRTCKQNGRILKSSDAILSHSQGTNCYEMYDFVGRIQSRVAKFRGLRDEQDKWLG